MLTFTLFGIPWNWPAPSEGVQLKIEHGKNRVLAVITQASKVVFLWKLLDSTAALTTSASASWSPSKPAAYLNLVWYTFNASLSSSFPLQRTFWTCKYGVPCLSSIFVRSIMVQIIMDFGTHHGFSMINMYCFKSNTLQPSTTDQLAHCTYSLTWKDFWEYPAPLSHQSW